MAQVDAMVPALAFSFRSPELAAIRACHSNGITRMRLPYLTDSSWMPCLRPSRAAEPPLWSADRHRPTWAGFVSRARGFGLVTLKALAARSRYREFSGQITCCGRASGGV